MPLKRCQSDGKSGYKWGNSGKCFTGPDGKSKALKQGRAIEISKNESKATNVFNKFITNLNNRIK